MRPLLAGRLKRGRLALAGLSAAAVAAVACSGSSAPPLQAQPPTPELSGREILRADGAPAGSKGLGPLTGLERRRITTARRVGWKTNFEIRTVRLTDIDAVVARDSVRPIDEPQFTSVAEALSWLDRRQPVILVELNGDARAYPLMILTRHEIVNDVIGGKPVVVTYCPLCNSSLAFSREVNGQVLRFGTSGMLRNSDLIMWDDRSQSWWQQLTGEAIVGDAVGEILEFLPAQTVTMGAFADKFPEGLVLRKGTGIDYELTPYTGYDDESANNQPFLFNNETDKRLPAVSRVAGFDLGSGPVAYPLELLFENPVLNVEIGATPAVIFFDDQTESAFRGRSERGTLGEFKATGSTTAFLREVDGRVLTFATGKDGRILDVETGSEWDIFGLAIDGELAGTELLPIIHGDHFWFAWAAFHPDTELVTEIDGTQG